MQTRLLQWFFVDGALRHVAFFVFKSDIRIPNTAMLVQLIRAQFLFYYYITDLKQGQIFFNLLAQEFITMLAAALTFKLRRIPN